MKHKGITHYSGEFAANVNLGQPGFLRIADWDKHQAGTGPAVVGTTYYPKANQWAAIKNSTDPTDGLNSNGSIIVLVECYEGISGLDSAVEIPMGVGDIIFGPFKSVEVKTGSALPRVLAYIG
jgi:hypothetical protein